MDVKKFDKLTSILSTAVRNPRNRHREFVRSMKFQSGEQGSRNNEYIFIFFFSLRKIRTFLLL